MNLHWQCWAALIAFAISFAYIWYPGPYLMGAFTFIAQPLFVIAAAGYGFKVLKELRQRDVI